MYLRCPKCGAATRAKMGNPGDVACSGCGYEYDLRHIGRLGSTPRERSLTAMEYAKEKDVDLATAYSALLGIHPSKPTRTTRRRTGYDRGFEKAVAAGRLTVLQAIERGDRVAFASKMATRHGLPMRIAFLVTDNRLSLLEAKRLVTKDERNAPPRRPAVKTPPGPSVARRVAGAVVALAAVAAVGAWGLSLDRERTGTQTTSPAMASPVVSVSVEPTVQVSGTLRRNAEGKITEIVGPNPEAVLERYCREAAGRARRALTVNGPPKERYGVFVEEGEFYRITLRLDSDGMHWVAGDGTGPIPRTLNKSPTGPTRASAAR